MTRPALCSLRTWGFQRPLTCSDAAGAVLSARSSASLLRPTHRNLGKSFEESGRGRQETRASVSLPAGRPELSPYLLGQLTPPDCHPPGSGHHSLCHPCDPEATKGWQVPSPGVRSFQMPCTASPLGHVTVTCVRSVL